MGWPYPDTAQGETDSQNDTVGDILTLGLGGFRANRARQAGADAIGGVALPNFNAGTEFEAPQYAGDFSPTLYQSPEAAQYQLASDSAEGRSAQLDALKALGEESNQAAGSQQDLDRLKAMQDASQLAQGREGAIRQDAARRGQIGGAADMIMRAQAAQLGANRNQEGGLQAAQQAALQRLQGTQAQAGLAGQLRGQDQALSMNNSDIINRFNLANTAARNSAMMGNTDLRNAAMQRNLGAFQDILNARSGAHNQNVSRHDQLTQVAFGDALQRAEGMSNAAQGLAGGYNQQGQNEQQLLAMLAKAIGSGMA